jgi:CRP-like cAMP-binding protein
MSHIGDFMKTITDQEILLHYIKKYKLDEVLELEDLLKGTLIQCQKRDVVINPGEELDTFYFFLEGKLKVMSLLENGKSLLFRFYTQLDTIGDIELFIPSHTDARVEVVKESYLLKIPMDLMRSRYLDNPKFLKFIGRSLSHKLRSISQNSAYNLTYPLINRLSSYIYEHMTEDKKVVFYSSYQDISELLGTTYRHLNRTLNDLQDMKIIEINKKELTIIDLNALKALAKNIYH